MCFYAEGYAELYKETAPMARKPHRCHECGGPVEVGRPYLRMTQVFEGEFWTVAVCRRCQWLRWEISKIEKAEGCDNGVAWPMFGDLYEVAGEYLADDVFEKEPPSDFEVSPATAQWIGPPSYLGVESPQVATQ